MLQTPNGRRRTHCRSLGLSLVTDTRQLCHHTHAVAYDGPGAMRAVGDTSHSYSVKHSGLHFQPGSEADRGSQHRLWDPPGVPSFTAREPTNECRPSGVRVDFSPNRTYSSRSTRRQAYQMRLHMQRAEWIRKREKCRALLTTFGGSLSAITDDSSAQSKTLQCVRGALAWLPLADFAVGSKSCSNAATASALETRSAISCHGPRCSAATWQAARRRSLV